MTASDYTMLADAPRGFRVVVPQPSAYAGVWVKVAERDEREPFLFGLFANTEDGRLVHYSNLEGFEVLR